MSTTYEVPGGLPESKADGSGRKGTEGDLSHDFTKNSNPFMILSRCHTVSNLQKN